MSSRRSHLTYALSILAIGTALLLAGPVGALADDSNDDSKQPNLKSWSNKIPSAKRFVVLGDFNNEAVLDRETGLVWEQSPDQTNYDWNGARITCLNKIIGGRKGWRLPAIAELASLIDPSVAQPGPTLPPGHPFTIPSLRAYWSVTTSAFFMAESGASDNRHAWIGNFADANVIIVNKNIPPCLAWCVRGGMNADAY